MNEHSHKSSAMRPMKAALFFAFSLTSLIIVGTAISHLWRTQKELAQVKKQISSTELQFSSVPQTVITTP